MSVSEGEELGRQGAGRAWVALTDDERRNVIAAIKICAIHAEDGFTTDAVWAMLDKHGVKLDCDRRAMGAAILACSREGYIVPTGEYRKSERSVCHANPKRVWRRA